MEPFIYAALIFIAYFAPTWIARKGRRGGVFVINLFGGWTMILWVVALYLAIRSNEEKVA